MSGPDMADRPIVDPDVARHLAPGFVAGCLRLGAVSVRQAQTLAQRLCADAGDRAATGITRHEASRARAALDRLMQGARGDGGATCAAQDLPRVAGLLPPAHPDATGVASGAASEAAPSDRPDTATPLPTPPEPPEGSTEKDRT